jgi:hypothetical protein
MVMIEEIVSRIIITVAVEIINLFPHLILLAVAWSICSVPAYIIV